MKSYLLFLTACLQIFSLVGMNKFSENKLLCSVDVVIMEGDVIEFCQGEFVTINASSGFVSYSWTGPQSGSSPSIAPTISGEYVVTAEDGIGCFSSDTIDVIIHPNPVGVITSSEGNVLCPGSSGTVLSLTQAYNSYLWGNGSTSASILVNQGGTYTVQITDQNGCQGNSSIFISQPNFTLNVIGSTTVCDGSAATLVATGGGIYNWSTGELGSSIVVSPETTTEYSVTIVNGACSETLFQTISAISIEHTEIQDTYYVGVGDVVFINGPANYSSYSWTPTENLTTYNAQGATFTGTTSTSYNVNSLHANGCTRSDSIWVIVINPTIPTGFSPNLDNVNDFFVIPELEDFKGKISIFNRWGDLVFESDYYQNNWDGTCQTSFCAGDGPLPEGTYFYSIEIENVHFDGFTTIKR